MIRIINETEYPTRSLRSVIMAAVRALAPGFSRGSEFRLTLQHGRGTLYCHRGRVVEARFGEEGYIARCVRSKRARVTMPKMLDDKGFLELLSRLRWMFLIANGARWRDLTAEQRRFYTETPSWANWLERPIIRKPKPRRVAA